MNCRTIGLAGSLALLAACHTAPAAAPVQVETRTQVIDTACSWAKPIYLDKTDVLSDATARAVLEYDRAGAAKCGWKPLSSAK